MGILFDTAKKTEEKEDYFEQYMNAPVHMPTFAKIEMYKFENWVVCPFCGKRQFKINSETQIVCLDWKCKGSNCKKEFEVQV